jgi:small subunit ribosomal protein S16
MLIIRLQRKGRKNEPTFRVVLTESTNSPKSGNFLEILGSYDPRDKNITKIDGDRVKEWIEKGAQVSDTVNNILINQGIIEGKKINVLPKKQPIVAEKTEEEESEEKSTEDNTDDTEEAPADEVKEEVKEETPTEEPKEEVKEEAPVEEVKEEQVEEKVEEPSEEEKKEEEPKGEDK